MQLVYKMLKGRRRPAHPALRKMRNASLKGELIRLSLVLCGVLALHVLAMMVFEGLSLGDAAWLTVTTATTVGYGDFSAETAAGRWSTTLLMYVAGISILAQVISVYFDYRQTVRERMMRGQWRWNMRDHMVFLNCPSENGLAYFEKALGELRKSRLAKARMAAVLVSDRLSEGLTQDLRELDAVHVSRPANAPQAFDDAAIDEADTVIILAQDMHDPLSDSLNLDLVHKLRERGVQATIIVEILESENKARARRLGADHVIRPIRSYPELLVRTILAPGTEQFIEDLFDVAGEECVRYDVAVQARWGDVAADMIRNDIGTPLAVLGQDDSVISSLGPDTQIDARAFFVLVREGNVKTNDEVRAALAA